MTNHDSLIFWITLAWLIISAHGMILTWIRFRDGLEDEKWLEDQNINGPRTIMARGGIRAAGTRLFLFTAFFLIGVNAMIGPTAPGLEIREIVSTVLLVVTLIAQAVAAQLDARDSVVLMTRLKIARAINDTSPDPYKVPPVVLDPTKEKLP